MAALTDSEDGTDDNDAPPSSSQSPPRALQLARPPSEGVERGPTSDGAIGVSSIMDDNVPYLMETQPRYTSLHQINRYTMFSINRF